MKITTKVEGRKQLLVASKFLAEMAGTLEETVEMAVEKPAPVVEKPKTKKAEALKAEPAKVEESLPVTEEAEAVKEALEKQGITTQKPAPEALKDAIEKNNAVDLSAKIEECRAAFKAKNPDDTIKTKAKAKLAELGVQNISTLPSVEACDQFINFLRSL